jgi:hypothetical protein
MESVGALFGETVIRRTAGEAGSGQQTLTHLCRAARQGQQKVTVEHVHVHSGGQAVGGMVETGGRVQEKSEEQPYAGVLITFPGAR